MKFLTVAVVLSAVVFAVSGLPPKYSDKYDTVDIDSILKNEKVLRSYVNCVLERGPCTQEGRDFRKHLPEAILTNCDKCTAGQKKIVRKAAAHLMKRMKPEWELIKMKYDPDNEHYEKFMEFMAEA